MFNLSDDQALELRDLAIGLLGAKPGQGFGQNLAQGLLLADQNKLGRKNQATQEQLKNLQLQQAQMQMAEQQRQQQTRERLSQVAQQAFAPGQMPADGMGPPTPGGGGLEQYYRDAIQADPLNAPQYAQALQPKADELAVYKPGDVVINKRTKQQEFVIPDKKPPAVEEINSLMDEAGITDPAERRRMLGQALLKKTTREPGVQVFTGGKDTFKGSMDLKKDFDSQPEVKGYKEVRQAWDQIRTALEKPSAANDLAAATKFMKMLDPGSVVRESELAMAMAATGKLDQVMNYANMIATGQKLTPQQRKDFYAAGKALHDAAQTRYSQTVQQYQGIGQKYGLDSQFIQPAKQEVSIEDLVKMYNK